MSFPGQPPCVLIESLKVPLKIWVPHGFEVVLDPLAFSFHAGLPHPMHGVTLQRDRKNEDGFNRGFEPLQLLCFWLCFRTPVILDSVPRIYVRELPNAAGTAKEPSTATGFVGSITHSSHKAGFRSRTLQVGEESCQSAPIVES